MWVKILSIFLFLASQFKLVVIPMRNLKEINTLTYIYPTPEFRNIHCQCYKVTFLCR